MGDHPKVHIGGENKELLSKLQESLKAVKEFAEGADKSLRTLSNLGQVTAGAFGMEFAYEKLKGFVEAADEAEMSGLRFGQVMKNMGDEALFSMSNFNELAETMKRTTVANQEEVQQAVQTMVTMGVKGNAMISESVKHAADLAFLMHTTLPAGAQLYARALEHPSNAMALLRRHGIAISHTQAQMLKSLEESGDKYGAQKALGEIMTAKAVGGAEAEKNSYGGQLKDFQNTLHESAIDVGHEIIGAIMENKNAFKDVASLLVEAAHGLGAVIKGIGSFISSLNLFGGDKAKDFRFNEQELRAGGDQYIAEMRRFENEVGGIARAKALAAEAGTYWDNGAPSADEIVKALKSTDAVGKYFSDNNRRGQFGAEGVQEQYQLDMRNATKAKEEADDLMKRSNSLGGERGQVQMQQDLAIQAGVKRGEARELYARYPGSEKANAEDESAAKKATNADSVGKPFRAQIEDLTAMNKRISEAAGSILAPDDDDPAVKSVGLLTKIEENTRPKKGGTAAPAGIRLTSDTTGKK